MSVVAEMTERDFEQVVLSRDPDCGVTSIIAVHDTSLGPALGGVRIRRYASPELAVADAMNLAEAMTYKAAVAGLDLGGGKSVVDADPRTEKTTQLLRAHARFVATLGGRYIPAVDMGTGSDDLQVMAGLAPRVSCDTQNPSAHTARGVFRAVEAALTATNRPLNGATVAVQGLGHVGGPLAAMLAAAGATVLAADLDEKRVEAARSEYAAQAVAVDDIVLADVDVLVPCAAGGVITARNVDDLKARAVIPAANNALADEELAGALADRGVLYVPDFVANAGGLMACDAEVNATVDQLTARVDGIGDTVTALLDTAIRSRITPLQAALDLARQRITARRAHRPWFPTTSAAASDTANRW